MHPSIPLALLAACLAGCSGGPARSADRLETLTSYSLAVSKRDYREAARYLGPTDRARLAPDGEGILPEYRDRIRAVRRTTLLDDPRIEVRGGLIHGLADILPVLGEAEAGAPGTAEAPPIEAAEAEPVPAPAAAPGPDPALRRAADGFFRAVSRRQWNTALGYVDEGERRIFIDSKGAVKESARRRLAAADTSGWDALTLKDGKLTGLVLIIPDAGRDGMGARPPPRAPAPRARNP